MHNSAEHENFAHKRSNGDKNKDYYCFKTLRCCIYPANNGRGYHIGKTLIAYTFETMRVYYPSSGGFIMIHMQI